MNESYSDKKELILEAAIKVFSEKGFHQAKVEQIASTAGIGKGTVYEYFRSKKELFQEIFISFLEKNFSKIKEEVSFDLEPKEALIKILDIQLKFVIKNKDIAKLMMNEHQEIDKDFKTKIFSVNNQKIELISNFVAKGINQGVFRQINPILVAMVMEGMIHSVVGSSMIKEVTMPKIDLGDIHTLLFDGLEK